jgi:hypothetical protein
MRDYVIRYLGGVDPTALDGWTWMLGKMPAEPDQILCFVDQGGPASFPHLLVDNPGLQVLVRGSRGGTNYNDGWVLIRKIRDAILGSAGHPAEFPELDGVTERGHIVPLGYDESDRHTWSSNYQLLVEPGTNAITHRVSL